MHSCLSVKFLSPITYHLSPRAMYSLSIDYLFNRVYDVLLWIKYVWLFVLLRKSPEDYLAQHTGREFDGLRDRGWFDDYFAQQSAPVPEADVHVSLWNRMLEWTGIRLPDSDKDGIPDASDDKPFDPSNISETKLKERYESDYTTWDHVRDFFGFGPADSDKDGVPTSYEQTHSMDPMHADTDRDGLLDGQELSLGTDPLNNDTDGDLVLDGRDEDPLDHLVSSKGSDADGDGVSDSVEGFIRSDPYKRDSDGDRISDNMDTYPLDSENVSQVGLPDFDSGGITFSVQNPVLALFVDLLSIMAIAVILFLVYAFIRWCFTFKENLDNYDLHFEHGSHGQTGAHHVITHATEEKRGEAINDLPAGIPNLPVFEEAPSPPPTPADFEDHPRFAIIQGYMSSPSEALWRIGIMEADNMLAEVLREKGYKGETVADMLKEASFKTIQMAWDAHGVRNRIAHEGSNFELTEREAKRAFNLYESVFRELKAIR